MKSIIEKINDLAKPLVTPGLDPNFIPAIKWIEAYDSLAKETAGSRDVIIDLLRPDGTGKRESLVLFPDLPEYTAASFLRVERLIKQLLWQVGGSNILIDGADEFKAQLEAHFAADGAGHFDNLTIAQKVYSSPISIENKALAGTAEPQLSKADMGGHLEGYRIGFDLGGSDRKCAAVINGEVVFSTEIAWSPYFETNPEYHFKGIQDSLEKAAEHLPRIDAIGGSAAGIYVDNQPRVASLFRGLSPEDFDAQAKPIFEAIQKKWDNVPMIVVNDGDVSALAGAMAGDCDSLLGIAMGTSLAAGYVDEQKKITSMLNELAFAPVDFAEDAAVDEWSHDKGCGVQYFSQQAVQRLSKAAGLEFPADMKAPEILVEVQKLMEKEDPAAVQIYETIGSYLGYTLALYAKFYGLKGIMLLGRVMTGQGGELIVKVADEVLAKEYPEVAKQLRTVTPDEKTKRHGQAIAAASLPQLG
ncbi:ROK family protein [Persicirhabdus sediminis]|uniref:ROK family protein n=1 Tax=Persicirhabdus sediminis TaxID=454144 RepID=A0A8J7MI39_9BACT|nr:ROK family protein [Persicirhabdus sediminis]MBK1792394.1 ROK family protein [Persicirhabdus sediminis]